MRGRIYGGRFGLAGLAVLATSAIAWAAAGDFDPTYGVGGVATATVPWGTSTTALAVQSSGEALLAGASIRRFTTGGVPDSTFGSGGTAAFPGAQGGAMALALDSDAIVAGGSALVTTTLKRKSTSQTTVSVARFSKNGILDTSFGNAGSKLIAISGATFSSVSAVALQPDRKAVVAGTVTLAGKKSTQRAWFVARLTSAGTLDSTFGIGGVAVYDPSSSDDVVVMGCIGLLPDGRIVVGGALAPPSGHALVARFSPYGAFETSIVRTSSNLNVLAVDAAGRIVAGGTRVGAPDGYVTRYLATGPALAIDGEFGTNGVTTIGLADYDGFYPFGSIAIDAWDRIVGSAQAVPDVTLHDTQVWTFRLTADGYLDSEFGFDGMAGPVDLATYDVARGVAVDDAGHVLVGGHSWSDGSAWRWFVARLSSD